MKSSIASFFSPQGPEESKPDVAEKRASLLSNATSIILVLATAVAVVFLVLATKENDRLRQEVDKYNGALAGPQTAQVGDIVPPFYSSDLQGKQAHLAYDGRSTHLLYIFAPGCSTCVSQIPAWNSLTLKARSANVKALGLSLDSSERAKSYLNDVDLSFDVIVIPNKAIQRAYRVVSIPQVMLVSPAGIVEWVHYGDMSESTTLELLSKIESR